MKTPPRLIVASLLGIVLLFAEALPTRADATPSLIAWQTGHEVMIAVVTGRVVSEPTAVGEGRLVGVYETTWLIHVVVVDDNEAELVVSSVPRSYQPHPIPIPIPLNHGAGRYVPHPFPVPIERDKDVYDPHPLPIPIPTTRVPLAGTMSPRPLAFAAPWLPCVDVQACEVRIAWQSERETIGRIHLDGRGISGVGEFTRGRNDTCEAVLNFAEP